MSQHHETGHAVNVANFDRLREFTRSLGSSYAPPTDRLKDGNLLLVLNNSQTSMETIDRVNAGYLKAMSARDEAFAPLGKLVTRIHYYVETLHTGAETLKAIKELVRKLHGNRAKAKKDAPAEEHKYISVSHLSFEQRMENFNKLIEFLHAETLYNPAETDLTLNALYDLLAKMHNTNLKAIDAQILLLAARNQRNIVLYAPLSGLVDVALDVKKYIRGAFGTNSDAYKLVQGLKFTRIRTM
jgi:hypothetical protein